MIGSRTSLVAALIGGLGALGRAGDVVTTSGPWRRSRSRRDWLRRRFTKPTWDAWKRAAKRKAQRRARRITRMHAR